MEMMSTTGFNRQWLENTRKHPILDVGQPKYVGQQANELSKWMNAESMTRTKEELNSAVPTIRQVLRVDDRIELEQMTKRAGALPGVEEGDKDKKLKRDPKATLRHQTSYRS